VCFLLSVQLLPETFVILRITERDMINSACKKPAILFVSLNKIIFLDRFSKKNQTPNFLKISPPGAASHADRWTDRHDEANCRFLQFRERA
jgi:hypothetical protein